MDNCSHNGDKLKKAVIKVAEEWRKRGFVLDEFISYISNKNEVSFPWTMIDKITPRPDVYKRQVATRSFGSIGIFAIPEMGRFYRHVLIEGRYPHHGAVAFGHFGKAITCLLYTSRCV